jgi:hypothetical protein
MLVDADPATSTALPMRAFVWLAVWVRGLAAVLARLAMFLLGGRRGLVAVAVLLCAAFAGKAEALGWTVQQVAVPRVPAGNLQAVDCTRPTACIAVGSNGSMVFAERWTGVAWHLERLPSPIGASLPVLDGVSCISARACTAVGYYRTSGGSVPLVERWDGRSWTIQTTPSPPAAARGGLFGVSCTSVVACTAVGFSGGGSPLVERWNGAGWAIEPTPPPTDPNVGGGSLRSVVCRSSSDCVAVGEWDRRTFVGAPSSITLAEHWDGTRWALQTTPSVTGARVSNFYGVSCSAVNDCTAVGESSVDATPDNGDALAAHWNGATWTLKSAPNVPGASETALLSVSCTASRVCMAVGLAFGEGVVAERWDGSSWTIQATPTETFGSLLSSVSCASARACAAVGYNNGGPLADWWDGQGWSRSPLISSPTRPADGQLFRGVSCASADACTAVGEFGAFGTLKVVVERWDGASWRIQVTPSQSGLVELYGVSCPSASRCFAVGASGNFSSNNFLPLVERWNGSRWRIERTPAITGYGALSRVSCSSPRACTAVGFHTDGSGRRVTLAQRWDGYSWRLQPTPNPSGASGAGLSAVSCPSATACTAVGDAGNSPLVEHWDGTAWSIQPTPTPSGTTQGGLTAVSCVDRNACAAVGVAVDPSGLTVTFAEIYNGVDWRVVSTPDLSGNGFLQDVSCTAAAACTAVGRTDYRGLSPLAERWDGSSWTIQATPPMQGYLMGVSCTSATACEAVGGVNGGGLLAENWLGAAL